MKLEFVTFAALAASAAAVPLRIITLTGSVPVPHLPPSEVSHSLHDEEEMRIMPHPHPAHMPCGKGQGSPFTDLLTRLGFVRPHPGHHHGHEQGSMHDSVAQSEEHHYDNEYKVVKAWKHHVEEMMGKVVPVLEGGKVRILPFTEDDRVKFEADQINGHEHGHRHGNEHMVGQKFEHGHGREHGQGRGGHLRAHGGHHWRHQSSSFGGRLHRAILHLTPPEAIALAFVLGAGIGSIVHLIFMFFLISIRRFRGQGRGERCKERRERRRMRKEARKAAKLTRDGKIALAEVEGEVLPSYQDGEGDRLVEKA